jgi:hypothetical protein
MESRLRKVNSKISNRSAAPSKILTLMISFAALLPATSQAQASSSASPSAAIHTVNRLFEAIHSNDAQAYSEVASKLVVMEAPDFGVPLTIEQARKVFDGCSLTSVSEPKPLEGVPGAFIIPATMNCSGKVPPGPLKIEFLGDDNQVIAAYPGGLSAFYGRH